MNDRIYLFIVYLLTFKLMTSIMCLHVVIRETLEVTDTDTFVVLSPV